MTGVFTLEDLKNFAREFVRGRPEGATVGLRGPLGAGKTTFVRFCVEAIAEREGVKPPRVMSPSFVIHQSYELSRPVDHFDFYRLEQAGKSDLVEIGFFEALDRVKGKGFVFVEWPEKMAEPYAFDLSLTFSLGEKPVCLVD